MHIVCEKWIVLGRKKEDLESHLGQQSLGVDVLAKTHYDDDSAKACIPNHSHAFSLPDVH